MSTVKGTLILKCNVKKNILLPPTGNLVGVTILVGENDACKARKEEV